MQETVFYYAPMVSPCYYRDLRKLKEDKDKCIGENKDITVVLSSCKVTTGAFPCVFEGLSKINPV